MVRLRNTCVRPVLASSLAMQFALRLLSCPLPPLLLTGSPQCKQTALSSSALYVIMTDQTTSTPGITGGVFVSFSPIKSRRSSFTPDRVPHLIAPPSDGNLQLQQRQQNSYQQFITCSPLVCPSNTNASRLQCKDVGIDAAVTTPNTLHDTGDDAKVVDSNSPTTYLLDSFDIEEGLVDGMALVPEFSGEHASKETSLIEECEKKNSDGGVVVRVSSKRTGIRTRQRFEPSPTYNVLKDSASPPFAAVKARHLSSNGESEKSSHHMALRGGALLTTPSNRKSDVRKAAEKTKKRSSTPPSSAPVAKSQHRSPSKIGKGKGAHRDTLITPTEVDVLFGKGGKINKHNSRFREEITKYVNQYHQVQDSKRRDKQLICLQVVHAVQGYGGRFLAIDNNGYWHEVDDRKAATKVGQGE